MMSSSTAKPASPLAPDGAAGKPDVVFKKQVLKLGLDGSSLPRLVVVTSNNVYICLPSGGITRTIDIALIERVTLCPREDMVNDEHDNESVDNEGEAAAREQGRTTPPSSSSKIKKETSRSPTSFFASVFSRGGSRSKSAEKQPQKESKKTSTSPKRRKGYKEDVDETHPASPKSETPASMERHNSSASTAFTPASAWAVIATLGIAFEAPLALQLLHSEDGMDFVAALRVSPYISDRAVFNMPDEDGPTNAAGKPIFAAPPRREDPVTPRILERDAEERTISNSNSDSATAAAPDPQKDSIKVSSIVSEGVSPMEEVELSPSSPRSTNVASPPPMPVADAPKADAAFPLTSAKQRLTELIARSTLSKEKSSEAEVEAEKQQQPPVGERRRSDTGALYSEDQAPPPSSFASMRSSPSSSASKASSVHTAEPTEAAAPAPGGGTMGISSTAVTLLREASTPMVAPTPLQDAPPASLATTAPAPPPQPTQQPQRQKPEVAAGEAKRPATTSTPVSYSSDRSSQPAAAAAATSADGTEGRTPSPLRAAPSREAPPPPPLQPVPSAPAYHSASRAAAEDSRTTTIEPTHDTGADGRTRRVLHMDDGEDVADPSANPPFGDGSAASSAAAAAAPKTTTPTMWEVIRDSEARAEQTQDLSFDPPMRPVSPGVHEVDDQLRGSHANNFRRSLERERGAVQPPSDPPARSPAYFAHRFVDDGAAALPSPIPPAGLNTTYHAAASTTAAPATNRVTANKTASATKTTTPAPTNPNAPSTLSGPAVRTPALMNTLQEELAEQSETVARLRRSLQAQESLLLELAEVKKEVHSLRGALAEREAQCAEWQAAYTHAEAHAGSLRREQQHLLAQQEEKLRRAHREELEAVQAAFEEYDTRMTDFVNQLQHEHRDEAAQWQHERRTLHHQIEELHQQQQQREAEEKERSAAAALRARAVAEEAAWEARHRHARSPSSPSPTSYLDPSLAHPSDFRPAYTGDAEAYYPEEVRERAQEKVDAYVAQRRRAGPATTTTPPNASPRPYSGGGDGGRVAGQRNTASSPPALAGATPHTHPIPASPWPQPRPVPPTAALAPPSAAAPPPQAQQPRIAFSAHRLFDNLNEEDAAGRPAGSGPSRPRRDLRGESLIQTPPSASLDGQRGRDSGRRDASGYVPHRRTFV